MTSENPTQMGSTNNSNNGSRNTNAKNSNNGGCKTIRFNNKTKGGGNGSRKGNGTTKGKGFTGKMTNGLLKGIVISSDNGIPISGQYNNGMLHISACIKKLKIERQR